MPTTVPTLLTPGPRNNWCWCWALLCLVRVLWLCVWHSSWTGRKMDRTIDTGIRELRSSVLQRSVASHTFCPKTQQHPLSGRKPRSVVFLVHHHRQTNRYIVHKETLIRINSKYCFNKTSRCFHCFRLWLQISSTVHVHCLKYLRQKYFEINHNETNLFTAW